MASHVICLRLLWCIMKCVFVCLWLEIVLNAVKHNIVKTLPETTYGIICTWMA